MKPSKNSKIKYNHHPPHHPENKKIAQSLPLNRKQNCQQDQQDLVKTVQVSNNKDKWMADFTESQQKIIAQQFNKMMKVLKKNLTSPKKQKNTLKTKVQLKTQRFDIQEPQNYNQQTVRKNVCTDRKTISLKSPRKHKNKMSENQIQSPKKQIRKHCSQTLQQVCSKALSPTKVLKSIKKNSHLSPQNKKKKKVQRSTQIQQQDNYFLFGDSFVGVNENQIREMESQIIQQSLLIDKDVDLECTWKQFIQQKQKISRQRIESLDSSKDAKKLKFDNFLTSDKASESQNEVHVTPKKNKKIRKSYEQQNSSLLDKNNEGRIDCISKISITQNKKSNQIDILSNFELASEINKQQNEQQNLQLTKKSNYLQEQIKTRTNAINLEMKSRKDILEKLLDSQKITKKVFTEHMNLTIQIYSQQAAQIQKIKQLLESNEIKIKEAHEKVKQSRQITQNIQSVNVDKTIELLFGNYKEQKKPKQIVDLNKQISDYEQDFHPVQNSLQDQIQSPNPKTWRPPQLQEANGFQPFEPAHFQMKASFKPQMDERIATQLGIIPQQSNAHFGTVPSIFNFLRNFLNFIKNYHLQQFLSYVNMPYGYSPEQRLKYMQGYDDDDQDEDSDGIVYGIQEVIRPDLLQVFHKMVNITKNDQKVFNRAIFDGINEGLNHFRPYFLINGPPYPWTTSEKALTYYFMREDCVEELFQKVQLSVLKWSSSLCGLLIQSAIHKRPELNLKSGLSIQQIFEKYTIETECELLEQRQQKIMKQQKIEANETQFQWQFYDEFKTAILYELSSCILEDLVGQIQLLGFSVLD